MKVVKFKDGLYAVRRRVWFLYPMCEFLDRNDKDPYWWSRAEFVEKYCKVETKEKAVALMNKFKNLKKFDIGTPV